MITAIDTNVLIALWDESDSLNIPAQNALDRADAAGTLVICGAVFAELLAGKGRTVEAVEDFLSETGIVIDWAIDEAIWRGSATAFQKYAARRRRQKQKAPRGLIADFLIGAHAFERGFPLLTFDSRVFKAAFPGLKIIG
ncbi:MAG TPA: PIN domain-containing protein [Pyrinomonadaceae bacterium]|nr:PIN domain-containing protein [Pyrinomonadaceae bacterium]